jgi:LmbE family N-acetylglucosaminyl deacetylase
VVAVKASPAPETFRVTAEVKHAVQGAVEGVVKSAVKTPATTAARSAPRTKARAERAIEGHGTDELRWQRWLAPSVVPVRPLAQWLAAAQRLVVVAPHPDDEVLACGGLIAQHAQSGGRTLVVAVSDGEASHHGSASARSPLQLGALRRGESAEGLRRLGAHDATVLRLGVPDGQLAAHLGTIERSLARELRASDVVVVTWRLDGHPDHEAAGRAAADACRAAGCRLLEAPVWMWHWAAPGDARVPWHRMAALALDPATLRLKRHALAAHATQHEMRDARLGPVLGPAIVARAARPAEYFFE